MKYRKNCPKCNSTRFNKGRSGAKCYKCGYVNKTNEQINKELEEWDVKDVE